MRVFLTGGSGFVGGALARRLREEGHSVRALVRASSKTAELEECGCELVRGGLDAERVVRRALEDRDVIFHVAGLTHTVRESDFMDVNATGARHILHAARVARFGGRFVLLSSLAAAGPARQGRAVTANRRPRPVSAYGRSKLEGERIALRYKRDFPITVLRPGAIYGPRERQIYEVVKVISKTGIAASIGPDIHLQMTHVDDVVSALMTVAKCRRARGRTYFVNDPQVWNYADVMQELGEALDKRVRMVRLPSAGGWAAAEILDIAGRVVGRPVSPFGRDKMREMAGGDWIADSTPLTKDCGWQPKWKLPEGLRDTVKWYRENGWL